MRNSERVGFAGTAGPPNRRSRVNPAMFFHCCVNVRCILYDLGDTTGRKPWHRQSGPDCGVVRRGRLASIKRGCLPFEFQFLVMESLIHTQAVLDTKRSSATRSTFPVAVNEEKGGTPGAYLVDWDLVPKRDTVHSSVRVYESVMYRSTC